MWANSGWPLSFSITAATPSCRPTRRLSRWATSWVSTTRESGAEPGQHRQQHVAFQRLRLVDDHERVVQRAAADVGQRQHLEHAARQHLVEHRRAGQRSEGVEDGLRPGRHLLALAAGQVAEFLAADRVQRPEDDDLALCCAAPAPPPVRRTAPARTCRCRPGRRARRCRRIRRAAGPAPPAVRRSGHAARTPRDRREPAAPACRR